MAEPQAKISQGRGACPWTAVERVAVNSSAMATNNSAMVARATIGLNLHIVGSHPFWTQQAGSPFGNSPGRDGCGECLLDFTSHETLLKVSVILQWQVLLRLDAEFRNN